MWEDLTDEYLNLQREMQRRAASTCWCKITKWKSQSKFWTHTGKFITEIYIIKIHELSSWYWIFQIFISFLLAWVPKSTSRKGYYSVPLQLVVDELIAHWIWFSPYLACLSYTPSPKRTAHVLLLFLVYNYYFCSPCCPAYGITCLPSV